MKIVMTTNFIKFLTVLYNLKKREMLRPHGDLKLFFFYF